MDDSKLHELMREYLKFSNYTATLTALETEEKTKPMAKLRKQIAQLTEDELEKLPRIYQLAQVDRQRSVKEVSLEKHIDSLEKNYNLVLNAAQTIYAIAIDATNRLRVDESTHVLKEQLSKVHNFIMMDRIGEEDSAGLNQKALQRL
jgi:hypothetical protein